MAFQDKLARIAQNDPSARATAAAYGAIPQNYLAGFYGNPGQDLSPELLQYLASENSGGRLDQGNGLLASDTSGRGIGYTFYAPGNQSYDYDQTGKFLRQYSSHDSAPGEFAKFMALVGTLGYGAAAAGGASAAGGAGGAAGAGGATTGAVGGATGALSGTELGALGATEGGMGAAGAAGMAGAAGGGGAAGTTAGMAGVGANVIPEGVAFTPATTAEMGSMGVGGAAAGGGGVLSRIGGALGGTGGGAGGFNWGSLVGPALSAAGGIAGADAAKDAANAQLQATREAQAKLEPWYQAGGNALNRLQELLGIGGNKSAADYGSAAHDFGMADFQADPGYAFRQQEQQQALQRAASASGGLGSGKYLKDAMNYSGGLASQEYGNAFNRFQISRTNKLNPLQSLAGQGQSTAQTIGDLSTQGGNAIAAGKVGQANALTNAIGQGYSMYQNQQQMDNNNSLMNLLLRRGM